MNGNENHASYTLEDLLAELHSLRTNRLLYAIAGVVVAASVWVALSQAGFEQEGLIRATMVVLVVYAIVVPRLGSARLVRVVRDLHSSPTPECISALVSSALYAFARPVAVQKLTDLCSGTSHRDGPNVSDGPESER
jgi:hypothetical protein